jgi:hypothetical protein
MHPARTQATIEELLSLIPDAYKDIGRLVVDNLRHYRVYTVRRCL